jgi:hypothetical protein
MEKGIKGFSLVHLLKDPMFKWMNAFSWKQQTGLNPICRWIVIGQSLAKFGNQYVYHHMT